MLRWLIATLVVQLSPMVLMKQLFSSEPCWCWQVCCVLDERWWFCCGYVIVCRLVCWPSSVRHQISCWRWGLLHTRIRILSLFSSNHIIQLQALSILCVIWYSWKFFFLSCWSCFYLLLLLSKFGDFRLWGKENFDDVWLGLTSRHQLIVDLIRFDASAGCHRW